MYCNVIKTRPNRSRIDWYTFSTKINFLFLVKNLSWTYNIQSIKGKKKKKILKDERWGGGRWQRN